MITIDQCKSQCNIELEELEFDRWFRQTIPAVTALIKNYLNRPLYDSKDALDAAKAELEDEDTSLNTAIIFSDDLKHAMLMMIAHWFENRETTSSLTIKDVPMSFHFLVDPYRLRAR